MTGLLAALLAFAVFIPLVAALVTRPQRGILLLAALVPFDGLLLVLPHPALLDGWKEALVLLTLAASMLAPPVVRGLTGRRLPSWWLAAVGLLVAGLASAAVVGGVQAVQGVKIGFFYLLVAVVLWRCPFAATDRDRLVSILMATGVLTAAVGVWQQVIGPAGLSALGYEYNTAIRTTGGLLRSFSTFNQPFPFGLFVMLVILVCVPVALADWRRTRNGWFLAATPLLLAGLLSSTVRAALLGTAVGLAFLAVHRYRAIAHVAAPLAIAALFVPAAAAAALLSSSSLGDRTSGWARVVDQVLAAPLGLGIGTTGSAAEKAGELGAPAPGRLASPVDAGLSYQPDNYYVKTLLELGPIGLWLLLMLLLTAFALARRISLRSSGGDSPLAAGIAASVLAAAAASTVATYFEIFPLDVYFWLLLGVLSSLPPGSSSTHSPFAREAAASRPTSVNSLTR